MERNLVPNRYPRKKPKSLRRIVFDRSRVLKRDHAIQPRILKRDNTIQAHILERDNAIQERDPIGVRDSGSTNVDTMSYDDQLNLYRKSASDVYDCGQHTLSVDSTVAEKLAHLRLQDAYDEADLTKLDEMTAVEFNLDRYARHGVHDTEMRDYVRTVTFQNCIEQCVKRQLKDKVVLVIRCGIGLLPMLCVRDGLAKQVIALEESSCIEYARCIIKDNFFDKEITLIQRSVHDLKKLPHGLTQVDVIMSDFMGECVLGQGNQMEQVIEARDRFLKPNGLMIPMCVALYGQLLEQKRLYANQRVCKKNKNNNRNRKLNQSEYRKNIDQITDIEDYSSDSSSESAAWCSWWEDVYGFDMRSEKEFVVLPNPIGPDYSVSGKAQEKWCILPEPTFAYFDPSKVVSNACLIKDFDMYECTIDDVRHVQCKNLKLICSTPFTSANGGDYAHMLELFMVVGFPDGQQIRKNKIQDINIGFSTSSLSPFTRFKQTGLLLNDQLLINKGDAFLINEFVMWRGHQQDQKNQMFDKIMSKNVSSKSMFDENVKIRMRYTFENEQTKAIDRRCVYTLIKYIF